MEDFEKENILQAHLYQKKSMHKTNASPDKNNIQTRLVSQKALHGKKITTSPGGKICSAWKGVGGLNKISCLYHPPSKVKWTTLYIEAGLSNKSTSLTGVLL